MRTLTIDRPLDRSLIAAVTGALALGGLSALVSTQVIGSDLLGSYCGPDAQVLQIAGEPAACIHEDDEIAGVDVTQRVGTYALTRRNGAGPEALAAAEEQGVVSVASTGTTPSVPCDGDGSTGYRVQAMYVVEAGQTNRYADLLPTLRIWAAGIDDVFNRSAALSGGVRNLRYVTEPGGGGCVARVLNVTVPAGSMVSFNATINAVRALGYDLTSRKYMMWTDANYLCGVATMYPTDTDAQTNPNNGYYAQYARIDNGCWGLGNGTNQHSVEAHEVLHMLGGVQYSAPHSTRAGHCWDESDTMCYADGGSHAMVQICPSTNEYLFDCNLDDYYSTFPDPGSYLDTHWNSADSRFLIGGGDGSGGGAVGSPTTLGAAIQVNNPAVPGLSTQVAVTPAIPDGRTLTSVTWRSARSDCTFSDKYAVQTLVTCNASSGAATTVSVTLVDSTGATKSVSSPLTFAAGGARPVQLALSAAGQSGPTAEVCTGGLTPVVAAVLDAATGAPVKGLRATFSKRTPSMAAPGLAGSGLTLTDGTSMLNQVITVPTTYWATSAATSWFATGAEATIATTPGVCAPVLSATKSVADIYYGDPVTVAGTVTRLVGGASVPVSGASIPIKLTTANGYVYSLVTAKSGTDGSFSVVVKPTVTGTLSARIVATPAYTATLVDLGTVTVTLPQTGLTGSVAPGDVGYGTLVNVSGALTRVAGGVTTPIASTYVKVIVTPATGPVATVGSLRSAANGTFSGNLALRASGEMSLVYAGSAGQPAKTISLGNVVAGTWSTAMTLNATATDVVAGSSVTLTGAVARTYLGATSPAPNLRLLVQFQPTGSATWTTVAYPYTTTLGTYSQRVYPRYDGTYRVLVNNLVGYSNVAQSVAINVL
jgi:hypothetical protein